MYSTFKLQVTTVTIGSLVELDRQKVMHGLKQTQVSQSFVATRTISLKMF